MCCRVLRLKGRGSLEERCLVVPMAAFTPVVSNWLPAACLPGLPLAGVPIMLLYLKSPDWLHSDVAAGAAAGAFVSTMSIFDVAVERVLAGAVNRQ